MVEKASKQASKYPTCKLISGYSRSSLYLVSQSFEGGFDDDTTTMKSVIALIKGKSL